MKQTTLRARGGQPVWIGDLGDYIVPEHLLDTPIRRDGMPDRRSPKMRSEMLRWVGEQEAAMRAQKPCG